MMFDHYEVHGLPTTCDKAEAEIHELRKEVQRLGSKSLVQDKNAEFWFGVAVNTSAKAGIPIEEAMDPIAGRDAEIAKLRAERDKAQSDLADANTMIGSLGSQLKRVEDLKAKWRRQAETATEIVEGQRAALARAQETAAAAEQYREADRKHHDEFHAAAQKVIADLASVRNMLADCVVKATEYGDQDDGFVAMYILPTGPIHRAIPYLDGVGINVRPGFDGRKALAADVPAAPDHRHGTIRQDDTGLYAPIRVDCAVCVAMAGVVPAASEPEVQP